MFKLSRLLVVGALACLAACVPEGGPKPVRSYVKAVLDHDYESAKRNVCEDGLAFLGSNAEEMVQNLTRLLEQQGLNTEVSVSFNRGDPKMGSFVLSAGEKERLGRLRVVKGVPCPESSLLGKFSSW